MAARKHLELQVIRLFALAFLVTFFTVTSALASQDSDGGKDQLLKQIRDTQVIGSAIDISEIPEFTDQPFITLHDNIPDFYLWQLTAEPYIFFSPLDKYGRTMTAMACLGEDTLPTEQRGQIGDVKPSGWQTVRYDDLIEDKFLYNRSHVIAYQLCGDNATPENLFTGTRYLNADSMTFFENLVAGYLSGAADHNDAEQGRHVLYRVTPVYKDEDLVATGVQMEAFSVEDLGKSVCFNVFLYNVQPGISIDYSTGDSQEDPDGVRGITSVAKLYGALSSSEHLDLPEPSEDQTNAVVRSAPEESASVKETEPPESVAESNVVREAETEPAVTYILNTNTKKFHLPSCSSVQDMKDKNKQEFYGSRDEAISRGYDPCGRCHP